jgi:membrane-associated phospholipid phosphatase
MAPAGARAARGARLTSVGAPARAAAEAAWRRRRDPQAQWLAALVVAFLGAAAAFGHVVEDYLTGDPIVVWDVDFARWLHEHSSPSLVDVFQVVTWAGNAIVLALVTALALALLLRRRMVGAAVLVVAVAAGIEALNAGLKLAFHRPRPELAFVHLDTYSFPSGHAAGSAAIYSLLAVLVARRLGLGGRILVGVATVALLLVIGFSRLYLGAHYLSDVLAGLSLGLAWTAGWLLAFEVLGAHRFARAVPRRARNPLT